MVHVINDDDVIALCCHATHTHKMFSFLCVNIDHDRLSSNFGSVCLIMNKFHNVKLQSVVNQRLPLVYDSCYSLPNCIHDRTFVHVQWLYLSSFQGNSDTNGWYR